MVSSLVDASLGGFEISEHLRIRTTLERNQWFRAELDRTSWLRNLRDRTTLEGTSGFEPGGCENVRKR